MYTKKEREHYNQHRDIVCEKLGITKNQYNRFRREGEKLHKVYENQCNGLYAADKDYIAEYEPIEKTIIDKASANYLYVYFQTDPRGASVYLDKHPIPSNNYTQANCIY